MSGEEIMAQSERSPSEAEVEAIKQRIAELESAAIMPMPQKPENESDPEQILEYRTQLATRHIRERLGKRRGIYSAVSTENLYEVVKTIVDSSHPNFDKLYNDIASKLTTDGARVDKWLTGVKEEQLADIVDIITKSDVPIHEETSTERYLHSQEQQSPELKKYVARDSTVDFEITNLYNQLPR